VSESNSHLLDISVINLDQPSSPAQHSERSDPSCCLAMDNEQLFNKLAMM